VARVQSLQPCTKLRLPIPRSSIVAQRLEEQMQGAWKEDAKKELQTRLSTPPRYMSLLNIFTQQADAAIKIQVGACSGTIGVEREHDFLGRVASHVSPNCCNECTQRVWRAWRLRRGSLAPASTGESADVHDGTMTTKSRCACMSGMHRKGCPGALLLVLANKFAVKHHR
jgi:hypothetical protein